MKKPLLMLPAFMAWLMLIAPVQVAAQASGPANYLRGIDTTTGQPCIVGASVNGAAPSSTCRVPTSSATSNTTAAPGSDASAAQAVQGCTGCKPVQIGDDPAGDLAATRSSNSSIATNTTGLYKSGQAIGDDAAGDLAANRANTSAINSKLGAPLVTAGSQGTSAPFTQEAGTNNQVVTPKDMVAPTNSPLTPTTTGNTTLTPTTGSSWAGTARVTLQVSGTFTGSPAGYLAGSLDGGTTITALTGRAVNGPNQMPALGPFTLSSGTAVEFSNPGFSTLVWVSTTVPATGSISLRFSMSKDPPSFAGAQTGYGSQSTPLGQTTSATGGALAPPLYPVATKVTAFNQALVASTSTALLTAAQSNGGSYVQSDGTAVVYLCTRGQTCSATAYDLFIPASVGAAASPFFITDGGLSAFSAGTPRIAGQGVAK